MVFLAAAVLRPRRSAMDQFRADPSMFNPAWIGKNTMDDNVALEFVFHDCPLGAPGLGAFDARVVLRQTSHGGTRAL